MNNKPQLTNDFVFSYTMASPGCEPAVQSFINATLEDAGRPTATSVKILTPFSLSDYISGKNSVLDIKVQASNGSYFNVEMQTVNKTRFRERILYYGSKLYSEQLKKGEDYHLLQPVISIVVARFTLFTQLSDMHNVFTLCSEKEPHIVFSDQLQIHSIELIKDAQNLVSNPSLQNWMEFFTHGHEKSEKEMDALLSDSGIATAANRYRHLCQNKKLRQLAMAQEKTERDRRAELSFAIDEGFTRGREQGRTERLQESILRRYAKRYPNGNVNKLKRILKTIASEDSLDSLIDAVIECPTESEFIAQVQKAH